MPEYERVTISSIDERCVCIETKRSDYTYCSPFIKLNSINSDDDKTCSFCHQFSWCWHFGVSVPASLSMYERFNIFRALVHSGKERISSYLHMVLYEG